MSDNVTPFRRPPPRPVRPQQSGGIGLKTHRGKVVLVHALTLACFAVQFLVPGQIGQLVGLGIGIAAAVIAYSSRAEAMPWAVTHHEQALRTLVIAFALGTVLALPGIVFPRGGDMLSWYYPVYFWGNIIIMLWAGLRALIGLVLAGMRRPVPNPRGWLV
jgi:uncharacterized membrane protein